MGTLKKNAVYVGVFESTSNNKRVRRLFEKATDSKWIKIKEIPPLSYPFKENPLLPENKWIVAFDGKKFGAVKSKYPKKYSIYAEYGTQDVITTDGNMPRTDRPIILVSEPNFKDPENWKPSSIDEKDKSKLLAIIQKNEIENCDESDSEKISTRKFKIKKSDLTFSKVYKSNKGHIITGVSLSEDLYKCDFMREGAWTENWYFIKNDGTVEGLGGGLKPIDAGDYDADGKSEFMFAIDVGDNQEGYRMFYNLFTHYVDFTWNNH